ncbi:MAG: radical SAM protein [Deltaproteobacteria bacterium]|jgi:wyosine [tRNA(Phe)-imidazoG37] synthetase (radical SAM superfamily)|nr:radical SAM protein [Deltaproteobacteria bacterium]
MDLDLVHSSPGAQVALYEKNNVYTKLLTEIHQERFLDYRREWKLREETLVEGDFPLSLDFSVNSGCQLNCIMCPLPAMKRHKIGKLIALKDFKRIMSEAAEHSLPAMTLGLGSEPLLNPEIFTILDISGKSGVMDIRLGTNGHLLSSDTIERILDSPLTRLEVSIDAVTIQSYKLIRGADYKSLVKKVERFCARKVQKGRKLPLLRLSFLELPENQGELATFISRWSELADMISIQKPIYFKESRLKRPKPQKKAINEREDAICRQPWQRLSILEDLSLWPCCSWYGEGLLPGKLSSTTVSQIWKGETLRRLRESLSEGPPTTKCKRCLDATPFE